MTHAAGLVLAALALPAPWLPGAHTAPHHAAADTGHVAWHYTVETDRDTFRVAQGHTTWLVEPGRPLERAAARLILQDNVPLSGGGGALMVRGWPTPRVDRWDSVSVTFRRGDRDEAVDGRRAEHYTLEAYVERLGAVTGASQRFRVEADLWILPDVPFSWAPFGAGPRSFPVLLPRVRERLEPRLVERGLVGRAEVRTTFTLMEGDMAVGGSRETATFRVARLRTGDPPPSPGPMVDRSVTDGLRRLVLERPDRTCRTVADGEVPAITRARVDYRLWPPLADFMASACRSPELYLAMIEPRIRADAGAVCRRVEWALSPDELARVLLTGSQRRAFADWLSPRERRDVLDELRRFCRS